MLEFIIDNLLIDKRSSIYLFVKLKALASWIFLSFTSFWRNSDSYEYKNKSARRGAQFDFNRYFPCQNVDRTQIAY
jgi:hypothetical protein